MSVSALLNVALAAPDAVGKGKGYAQKQRDRRTKPEIGTHPPGGAPPMRKISAKHLMEKKAGNLTPLRSDFARALPYALGMGAATAAGTMMAGGAARGVGSVFQKFKSNRMFKELQQRYPEIRRHKDARKYFDMVVAYAPSLMRHHAAIGDFLSRQLQYPMSSIEFIKQLADLEATVSKTESQGQSAQFARGTEMAASSVLPHFAESYHLRDQ